MNLFGLGPAELGIIAVLVLLFFGPKRLPQIGKSLGSAIKSIRDGIEGKDEALPEAVAQAADDAAPATTAAEAAEPVSAKPATAE